MGTCKMGTDDGRTLDGTAVVDTNTKIYGTDNMFVVDASIFPGMPSTNPSALIVTAAERASDLILALPPTRIVGKYGQCAGLYITGTVMCPAGTTCTAITSYYSIVRRLVSSSDDANPRSSPPSLYPNFN
jgi:cellobiose dehydrogenase (acceptor)